MADQNEILSDLLRATGPQIGAMRSTASALTSSGNAFSSLTGSLTQKLLEVAKGQVSLASLGGDATRLISVLNASAGSIAKTLLDVGLSAQSLVDINNQLSGSGISFQQDLGQMVQAATGTYEPLNEFGLRMMGAASSITQLDAGVSKSVLMFSKLSRDLQEIPISRELKAAGVSSTELNNSLVMLASSAKLLNFQQESTQRGLVDSAVSLTEELDILARMTGRNRLEQQRALETQLKTVDMQLLLANASKEQRDAITKNVADVGAMMSDIQVNLYKELVAGQGSVLSKAGAAQAAAMSNQSGEGYIKFQESARLANSQNVEDLEKSKKLLQEAIALIGESAGNMSQGQIKMLQAQPFLTNETGKAMSDMAVVAIKIRGMLNALENDEKRRSELRAESERTGKSMFDLMEEFRDKLKLEQRGLDEKGDFRDGAGIVRTINAAGDAVKTLTASVTVHAPELSDFIGNYISGLGDMNQALGTSTEVAEKMSETFDQTAGRVMEFGHRVFEVFKDNLPDIRPLEPAKRKGGSLEATGSMIEDFGIGTPAILHGREGVITEDQLTDYTNKILQYTGTTPMNPENQTDMFRDYFNQLNQIFDEPQAVEPPIDYTKFVDYTNGFATSLERFEQSIIHDRQNDESSQQLSNAIAQLTQALKINNEEQEGTATNLELKLDGASFNEIKTMVMQLNNKLATLTNLSADLLDTSKTQTRVIRDLSNNRLS